MSSAAPRFAAPRWCSVVLLALGLPGCGLVGYQSQGGADAAAVGDGGAAAALGTGGMDAAAGDTVGIDAALLDEGGLDAGGLNDGALDAATDAGQACIPLASSCVGSVYIVCDGQGAVESSIDCSQAAAPCMQRDCTEAGCVSAPLPDGTACGLGFMCNGGRCEGATTCLPGADCQETCGDGSLCDYDCTGARRCDVDCRWASTCDVMCDGATACSPRCREGSGCKFDCGTVNDCTPRCEGDSQCYIACSGAANCNQIRCESQAQCVVDCGIGSNGCSFQTCDGVALSCPNNVIVCNTACP